MQEIFEEYGEFIIEAISSFLFLGILSFLDSPMRDLLTKFITSVVGGG